MLAIFPVARWLRVEDDPENNEVMMLEVVVPAVLGVVAADEVASTFTDNCLEEEEEEEGWVWNWFEDKEDWILNWGDVDPTPETGDTTRDDSVIEAVVVQPAVVSTSKEVGWLKTEVEGREEETAGEE